jgi:drug/metabolite transporter (DMT)-like permease
LAYVLSFIGVYILVASGGNNFKSINLGDASAFITALFWAGYMLTGKKARLYFDNTTYAIGQYATTAILFFACTLYTGSPLTGYDNTSWYSVAGLVLLPTLLGHYSFTYLVQYMNLSLMTCGKLIEPAIASLMAYFIFNETLNSNAWISFALTSFSVLILFSPNIKLALQKNN